MTHVKHLDAVRQALADETRALADRIDRGEVVGVAFACQLSADSDGRVATYYGRTSAGNTWTLLGALEDLKLRILSTVE